MPTSNPPPPAPAAASSSSSASLSSLNNQLIAHGYAKRPLRLSALSDADQAHASGVICELLGASVSNLSALEDLNARHRTLQWEYERLSKTVDKHERHVARLEGDVEAAKLRAVEAERHASAEEDKVKSLREDVNRSRKAVDNLRVAATQEAKRQQIKLDKVLGQLARTVPAVPVGFELLNPIPPGGVAPVAPGPLPLLEQALSDLADIRQNLQEETEAFRHVVVSTANSLREALAAGTGEEPPRRLLHGDFFATDTAAFPGHRGVRQLASSTAHPAIADARLKALVADVRAALTTDVSPIMRDGSGATEAEAEAMAEAARIERERQRAESDLRDRVKDLEVEIAIAHSKEVEANKVVEEMAKLNVGAQVPSTTDFEDSRLRDELVRQKRVLDAERDALMEASVRLSEDRVSLDAARATFETDKAAAIAAAIASAVPLAPPAPEPETTTAALPDSPPRKKQPALPTLGTPQKHKPSSPSPLSPHKPRTPSGQKHKPGVHVAGKRRAVPRTPLSRLVLERAVLERDRSRKSSTSLSGGDKGVLGESAGASRTNVEDSRTPAAPEAGPSTKPRLSGDKPRVAFSTSAGDKDKEARRVSGDKSSAPPTETRKSSLTASTAASAARLKELKEGKEGGSGGGVRSAAKTSRAWR